MWSAHCLARLLRSSIAAIGKSRSLGVCRKTNCPRLKFSHVGRSIGWMFSHARFSSLRLAISLSCFISFCISIISWQSSLLRPLWSTFIVFVSLTWVSISGFLVKSTYLFILSAQRSKLASSLSPKATKLFSIHSPKAIRRLIVFSIPLFSLSITFNMNILNHRSARKSTLYFIFFYLIMRHSLNAAGARLDYKLTNEV